MKLKLPAVVSADLRLNEPRYATLPNIMVTINKFAATVVEDRVNNVVIAGLRVIRLPSQHAHSSGNQMKY